LLAYSFSLYNFRQKKLGVGLLVVTIWLLTSY